MNKKLLAIASAVLIGGMSALSANALTSDTMEKIKNTGTVNLGVRESSGLAYSLGKDKYVGFHTEMAERIIDDLSKDVGKELKIKYQPITSENRIPLVQNGTIDFECGSTTNNKTRAKQADFANTTYVEEVRVAVKKDSGIKTLADLKDKTVATTTGTTSVVTLRKKSRTLDMDFKEINGKDHSDSFLLLESGRADAFIMDGSILAVNIAKAQNPDDYVMLDEVLSVEPIACMLRLNDENLKNAINKSIERQVKDGSLEQLYNKWFMEPIPPTGVVVNLPLSKSTREAWENPNATPMEDYEANKN